MHDVRISSGRSSFRESSRLTCLGCGALLMRIQQFLAQLGYGSRRAMEAWLRDGRIRLNGAVASLGDRVGPEDQLYVAGQRVELLTPKPRMLLYYKPAGEICSHRDTLGKGSCFDRLPPLGAGRWQSVGRLDAATSGLLLMTTCGPWVEYLTHPSTALERVYWVKGEHALTESQLRRLCTGIKLSDGLASIVRYRYPLSGAVDQCEVVVAEGRNRLVRRLFEAVGCPVKKLKRLQYGPFVLPERLAPGHYIELSPEMLTPLAMAAHKKLTTRMRNDAC